MVFTELFPRLSTKECNGRSFTKRFPRLLSRNKELNCVSVETFGCHFELS